MRKDLTEGSVIKNIVRLALPIIGSSFMQLAYNFIDMLWVGRLGSDAVAAVGTSGFFMHLGWAIASIVMVGTGITIAQAVGEKDERRAKFIATNGLVGVLILTLIFVAFIQIFYKPLVGFFNMSTEVDNMAFAYLKWVSLGLMFLFTSQFFSRISNSRGDSRTPFLISTIGLVLNIILDPLFIFTFNFGVLGAAWASIISQMVVVSIFLIKKSSSFLNTKAELRISFRQILQLAKLGLPPSTQYMIFSLIAIAMAKIVSGFGSDAIAAQKIGHQIEAITFITVGGLNSAVLSFTGQNYGAKLFNRIKEGYWAGFLLSTLVGTIMTVVFLLFPDSLLGLFVTETATIEIGADYLTIVGLSQVFMCIEMTASGILNGIGKTKIPSSINILMILVRIPLALILSQEHMYGVNGVWYAILISTVLRGTILNLAYHFFKNSYLKKLAL